MAEKKPVDELSRTPTTGHEWDGIRELNTPCRAGGSGPSTPP